MFKKAFAAVCLAGLAALCVGETYTVTTKPLPCDFLLNMTLTTNGVQVNFNTKYHGNFTVMTSVLGITLARPDLGVNPDGDIYTVEVSDKEDECTTTTAEPLGRSETLFFEHKEEGTFNGKKCFKYYNTTNEVYWIDADNNLLAMESIGNDQARTLVEVVRQTTAFPRETFVLPEGYKCAEKPEVFKAPSKEAYDAACRAPTPSSAVAAGVHKLAVLGAVVMAVLLL